MPLAQGQVLNNRYRIAKLMGQGGFGAVYRAWDTAVILVGLRRPNLPEIFLLISEPFRQ